ncbi:MAG TPA: baseplate J/gp47 family protein [Balneolales bacterium]|nr:baseplate J/gp47 family protein [Balneolales bacterium]
MSAPDRITSLLGQSKVTGIDFIDVDSSQTQIDIYFLRSVTTLDTPLPGSLAVQDISIYTQTIGLPEIKVRVPLQWMTLDGKDVLRLHTDQPGDFSWYHLKIDDARIDPYYNDVPFSFKANCPSDLDCARPPHECPPDELVDFPVNYLARDFWSYRTALLDFASLRYPDWKDRLEADAGMMMVELMSAVADEMAYYQDRVAGEAYLESATQRRSIRRHARLVDYHMHDGLGAFAWLDFTIDSGADTIAAGEKVFAFSDQNLRVCFETGKGILETVSGTSYPVNAAINDMLPHSWDEDQVCLPVGTTEMYLQTDLSASLVFDDFVQDAFTGVTIPGKWILLQTIPANPAQPVRRQVVRVTHIEASIDPVSNQPITLIRWQPEHALRNEFDMEALHIRGNIIPATAGETREVFFIVDRDDDQLTTAAINALDAKLVADVVYRLGHDGTDAPRFTLPDSQTRQLVYLGDKPSDGRPEIVLEELQFDGANWVPSGKFWDWHRSLVGVSSSLPLDNHFTLDDGSWQRVVSYQRIGETFLHDDYAMDAGVTIRWGDGEFGRVPDTNTVFSVRYRLGSGRYDNLPAGSLTSLGSTPANVSGVTNPLPSAGGADRETATELRQVATEAFRALTYRAVKPGDYAEAAERLPWVQKAGAQFRWSGSWLTAFVTADPKGKVILEPRDRFDMLNQENRFRQAGREVALLDPVYADIDLEIEVCVKPDAYGGEVKQRVMLMLMGRKGVNPIEGFFSPDHFTFGTLLERSVLEAAIQAVPGVRAVEAISFRRRGWFGWRVFVESCYNPGINSIIRIQNDPAFPERGIIRLYTNGGL